MPVETVNPEQQAQKFQNASPAEVLTWANETYGDRLALACSLGIEDMVLVDMLVAVNPRARVFVLDTGRLHQETYDVMAEARAKYGMEFEVYFPDASRVEELLRTKGPNSFYESVDNRKECCHIRKVEPLKRALSGLDAWITGLRREQSVTRGALAKVERDDAHSGLVKINPLADWTEDQVWEYARSKGVPYNVLHNKGYPSIGCAPCTRAIEKGEDVRAGRWWWENPDLKECGIHIKD